MHIALATAAVLPKLDEDGPALIAALEARGHTARPAVWSDPDVDWAAYDRVIIRSTWDYAPRRAEYLAWADHVAAVTRLHNPAPLVRWNTDKHYLGALATRGVPVVPTRFLSDSEPFEAPDWSEYVVKPTVSAGARDTARFGVDEEERAAALVARIRQSGRDVMVQPYQSGVDAGGETALVFFAGRFSHAIRKGPMLPRGVDPTQALYAPEQITARIPSPAELDVAHRVLAALPVPAEVLTYARVDLIPGPHGPLLIELEITEPSLFLGFAEGATERFAEVVVR